MAEITAQVVADNTARPIHLAESSLRAQRHDWVHLAHGLFCRWQEARSGAKFSGTRRSPLNRRPAPARNSDLASGIRDVLPLVMQTTNAEENDEEIELESRFGRAARLTFMGSLGFWPLFLFAVKFMLDAPINAGAALTERKVLVGDAWCYPLIVVIAWLLAKQGLRRGRSDFACVIPWIMPALAAAYWLVYFLL